VTIDVQQLLEQANKGFSNMVIKALKQFYRDLGNLESGHCLQPSNRRAPSSRLRLAKLAQFFTKPDRNCMLCLPVRISNCERSNVFVESAALLDNGADVRLAMKPCVQIKVGPQIFRHHIVVFRGVRTGDKLGFHAFALLYGCFKSLPSLCLLCRVERLHRPAFLIQGFGAHSTATADSNVS
jgi:hypothetical protein